MPPPALMLAAAIVTALAAAAGCFLARGTTAVPAAAWAVVAAAALAGESAALAVGWLTEPSAAAATRLIVAALAVCPAASLLGAKRPQHGVWQFIVATLAGVLMLPAVSAVLVRPGSMPDVHMIERVLLVVLVVVGWLNFVATRHGLAATLVAGGQLAGHCLWASASRQRCRLGWPQPLASRLPAGQCWRSVNRSGDQRQRPSGEARSPGRSSGRFWRFARLWGLPGPCESLNGSTPSPPPKAGHAGFRLPV